MKKRLRHRFGFIGVLFAFAVAIWPTTFAIVPEKKEARVTQSIHDVQLLAPNAAPRQLQLTTMSTQAQPCEPAAIRARSLLSRIEPWRGSARTASSVSAKESSIWRMAASCCTCRKVLAERESTPRLQQWRGTILKRWLCVMPNYGSNSFYF